MRFEFSAPALLLFGEGTVDRVGSLAAERGSRAFVVEGASGRAGAVVGMLGRSGVDAIRFGVAGEPTTEIVERGAAEARAGGCDLVVAFGGGSVIDAGKAIAALITNRGELRDYLEVVGKGKPITETPAPLIAVPTTAGAGAEVTRNAVLTAKEERVKVSMRSPLMLPVAVVVDPELTYGLPPELTATTGLDALTQCIEPLVSVQANPITDGLAREGIRRAAGALRRAYADGSDHEARRDMAVASLCGGLALANAKLGAVHGLAAPLGGMFPAPHGAVCARLLPAVIRANVGALRTRHPNSPALERYDEVARLLTERTDARAEAAIEWLTELVSDLRVPRLGEYGIDAGAVSRVAEQATKASSTKGNPVELGIGELEAVLSEAL
jgi:alcohol dehydrogenase class IV